jgi:thioredoxin 1
MITITDFYADWCGPCQAMKPIFKEVEGEYSGKVTFTKVDVEASPQEASDKGVFRRKWNSC